MGTKKLLPWVHKDTIIDFIIISNAVSKRKTGMDKKTKNPARRRGRNEQTDFVG